MRDIFISRKGGLALWLIAMLILGLGLGDLRLTTQLDDWSQEAETQAFDISRFGNPDQVVILVKTTGLFTGLNLKSFRDLRLGLMEHVRSIQDIHSILSIRTTQGPAARLSSRPLIPQRIPYAADALDSLRRTALNHPGIKGALMNAEATEAVLFLELEPYTQNQEWDAARTGEAILTEIDRHQRGDFRILAAGVPISTYEQGAFFNQESVRLAGLVGLVAILFILLVFRSLAFVLTVLLISLSTLTAVLGLCGLAGLELDATLFPIPLFLSVATSLGHSIHIYKRYLYSLDHGAGREEAMEATMAILRRPLFHTMLTTFAALLSFNFISMEAVRQVGNLSALMVLAAWANCRFILPGLVVNFFRRRPNPGQGLRWVDHLVNQLSKGSLFLLKRPATTGVSLLVLLLFLAAGARQVQVSGNSLETLGSEVPFVQKQVEMSRSSILSPYTFNIFLRQADPDSLSDMLALVPVLQDLETYLKTMAPTLRIASGLDGLRLLRDRSSGDQQGGQLTLDRDMLAQLDQLPSRIKRRWVDEEQHILRMVVGFGQYDHQALVELREGVAGFIRETHPGVELVFSGTILRVAEIQEQLLRGQMTSILVALLIIALMLVIIFRSVSLGLVALVPNLVPVLAVSATMGYLGIPLDSITITLLPMVLGISVDDTIHLMMALHSRSRNTDLGARVSQVFSSVVPALMLTTLVMMLVFSVYLSSAVLVFRRMSLLVGVALLTALLTDMFFTPALSAWIRPSSGLPHDPTATEEKND